MESNSVSKLYCESLDKFVAIRECVTSEATMLVKDISKINGKKSYYDLIITYCVVDYFTEIFPIFENDKSLSIMSDIIKEELYSLCIKINPSLDIKLIRLPAAQSKIPLLGISLQESGMKNIANLDIELKKYIIGQDAAVDLISKSVRRACSGLKDSKRPVSSFSFVGRTGVGKTEMAKALCRSLYGNETDCLVRIDCSEYSQPHEYAKLIGSPPGYIGYGDGGMLCSALKKNQNVIVLFDEIEKAHRKVHNLLLQIMDEGSLKDNKGETIVFNKSIIIMTSNVGIKNIDDIESSIGFTKSNCNTDTKKRETIKDFEKHFSPEFINRIDEVIMFRELVFEDRLKIANKMLREIRDRASNLGFYIEFGDDIAEFVVNKELNPKYGAREIRRIIIQFIEVPLSERIVINQIVKNSKLRAMVDHDKISFRSIKKQRSS